MKRAATLLLTALFLAACVDTTGISPQSKRPPRGNPQAAVVVTEFADLQCPACRAAQTTVVKPILEKYGTQVRFDFKFFPIRSIHRFAMDLAEAAECSADQGKFWEFTDMAFEKQPDVSKQAIKDWAASLKLDMSLFDRCTRSHIKRDEIMGDYNGGKDQLGVVGTPTFFVNGEKVESTVEAISAAIDAAVKGTASRL